jgi:hypothetical protein
MRIKASLPSYKQIEVEISPNKTIRDLKKLVCTKLGIEAGLTKLLLHGKPLAEAKKLLSTDY